MEAEVPKLNNGLSIRLTVMPVEVGMMGLYINIAPYGVDRLTKECTKNTAKNMHSLTMQTWGVKSTGVGVQATIAYQEPGLDQELGVGHLLFLGGTFPQTGRSEMNPKPSTGPVEKLPESQPVMGLKKDFKQ